MNTANTTINGFLRQFRSDRTKRNRMFTLLLILSLMVAVAVFYQLRLTALTLANDADCGYTEHVHSEECMENTLICGFTAEEGHAHSVEGGCYTEETLLTCALSEHAHSEDCYSVKTVYDCADAHTHSEGCYTQDTVYDCTEDHAHTVDCSSHTEQILTCGQTEHSHSADCASHEEPVLTCSVEEHTHCDACYTVEQTLVCTQEEAVEEHVHSDACYEMSYICGFEEDYEHVHTTDCYSDDTADVETAAVWEATFKNVELTGDWAADLLAIANTQLGYTESTENWRADENHVKKGYTRYGAWYGSPFGDWCAMFVSFCLNYAGVPEDIIPWGAGCASWMTELEQNEMIYEAAGYDPQPGDILFFDNNGDGYADHVGIVRYADASGVATIEGNTSDRVANQTYGVGDASIIAYCPVDEICQIVQGNDLMLLASDLYDAIGYSRYAYTGSSWLTTGDRTENTDAAGTEGEVYCRMTPGGNISAGEYYIVDKYKYESLIASLAEAGTTLESADGQSALEAISQVAYCYNYYDLRPLGTNSEESAYYDELSGASSFDLGAAGTGYSTVNSQTLQEQIIAISLNGYPHDKSNIQTTYGLTNGQFRALTQYAIWYYTDGIRIDFSDYDSTYGGYWAGVFTKSGTALTYNENAVDPYRLDLASAEIIAAYNALIGSDLSALLSSGAISSSDEAYINLYDSVNSGTAIVGGTETEKPYQNLLTVGISDSSEPTIETGRSLEVNKTVVNGNTEELFEFTIKLFWKGSSYSTDSYTNAHTGTFPVTTYGIASGAENELSELTFTTEYRYDENDSYLGSYGVAKVSLAHGQSIKIDLSSISEYLEVYYIVEETSGSNGSYVSSAVGASNEDNSVGISGPAKASFTNTGGLSVRIQARKTMDGATPEEGAFSFILLDENLNQIGEPQVNDAEGYVTFPAESLPAAAGTYTYYVQEISSGNSAIAYDNAPKQVEVTVYRSQEITEFEQSTIIGYEGEVSPGLASRYVRVNGTDYPAYCINMLGGTANRGYNYILDPTQEELEAEIMAATYGDALKEDLRKVVYYLNDKKLYDELNYTLDGVTETVKLNYAIANYIVWYMTGHEVDWDDATMNNIGLKSEAQMEAMITVIIAEAEQTIPESYKLILLTGKETSGAKQQPVVIGLGTESYTVTSTETLFTALQNNVPVIENKTSETTGNSLTIAKTVTGSGDKNALFTFTVELWTKGAEGNKTAGDLAGLQSVKTSGIASDAENYIASGQTYFSLTGDSSGTYVWANFQLAHGQSVTIAGLPDDFYYAIAEVDYSADGYTTAATNASNSESETGATGSVTASFVNHIPPSSGESYTAQITARKYLDGALSSMAFTFDLYDSDGDWVATAQNDPSGTVTFPEQTYTEPGVYTYTIRERRDQGTGYTYANDQTITVTIGGSAEITKVLSAASIEGVDSGSNTIITATLTFSDGTTETIDVWCIDNDAGTPANKNYHAVLYPTAEALAGQTTAGAVIPKANYSQTDIREALKRAIYWLPKAVGTKLDLEAYDYSYGGMVLWSPSMSAIQDYIWWLTGATDYTDGGLNYGTEYQSLFPALFKYLEAQGEPEEPFELVLFEPTDGGQPVVAGYTLDTGYAPTVTDAAFYNTSTPMENAVELKAKKTLNGGTPSEGQFTFILSKNGKEIARSTNDADGYVRFLLTDPEAGEYVITELDDGQTGIYYDKNKHVFTVAVTGNTSASSGLNEVVAARTVTISNSSNQYAVTGTGVTTHYAYPIWTSGGGSGPTSGTTYTVSDTDITNEKLAGWVSANNYGENLLPYMERVLYCFSQRSTTETASGASYGGFILNATNRNNVMAVLCGSSTNATHQAILKEILDAYPESSVPDGELAYFTADGYMPMIAFYVNDTTPQVGSATVTYQGDVLSDTNLPTFENSQTNYSLPQTGGAGRLGYLLIGGALLMTTSFLIFRYGLRRNKGRRLRK